MDRNKSEIAVIVDRSGSMNGKQDEVVGGFNRFLKEQQESGVGSCRLTYCQFDDVYEIVHDGVDIHAVPPLNRGTYVPRGMTALLDAVGRTILRLGARLVAMEEAERPAAVIVVIITDGLENASKEFSAHRIAEMVKEQTEVYSWNFVFLGQGLEAFTQTRSMGLDPRAPAVYAAQAVASPGGVLHAYSAASLAVSSTRSKGARGVSRTCGWSPEDKEVITSALLGEDQPSGVLPSDSPATGSGEKS